MKETSGTASAQAPETISPWEPVTCRWRPRTPMPVVTRPETTWSHGDHAAAPSDAVDEGHGPSSTGVNGNVRRHRARGFDPARRHPGPLS